jgi:hypothetical protein
MQIEQVFVSWGGVKNLYPEHSLKTFAKVFVPSIPTANFTPVVVDKSG